MASTLAQLVQRTHNLLNQSVTNVGKLGTLTELTWNVDGVTIATMKVTPVDGVNTHVGPALMEVAGKLVYASNYDASSGVVTVPAWGNGVQGSDPILDFPGATATMVSIDPVWTHWHTALNLIDAMRSLYPKLFGVGTEILTSTTTGERYTVNTLAEEILKVQLEGFGPSNPRREISRFSLDAKDPDTGVRQLTIRPVGISGRPIHVWYRKKPVIPSSPADASWTWSTTGLPDSAEDLAILRAAASMIMAPEAAKTQVFSAEVSDRSRFVQAGTATAISRRFKEQYEERMAEEQQKLHNQYHVRPRLKYNG